MFDPADVSALTRLDEDALSLLPEAESEIFEYKSSLASDRDLSSNIDRAASAFWNSGGGVLVLGVSDSGKPDGGIAPLVGRQSRRDWIDQILVGISPRGKYELAMLSASSGDKAEDSQVVIIGFERSLNVPHMAADRRYYIRAGAHTLPATHFVVESLYARRGATSPQLAFFIAPDINRSSYASLNVVALNSVPALNVDVTVSPWPPLLQRTGSGQAQARVVATDIPLRIPFTLINRQSKDWHEVDSNYDIRITYEDSTGKQYSVAETVLPRQELRKPAVQGTVLDDISLGIQHLANQLAALRGNRG